MAMSKREKTIGIATVAVVGTIGLFSYVISPQLDALQTLDRQITTATLEKAKADSLLANNVKMSRRWTELTGGPIKRDASEAESQVLNAIRDWAQDSGMILSSVKPERTEKQKEFARVTFRATGTGGLGSLARFLYRVQTATIPVRVSDATVTSRKEGTDDLTLNVGISTTYLLADPEKPQPPRTTAAAWPAAPTPPRGGAL